MQQQASLFFRTFSKASLPSLKVNQAIPKDPNMSMYPILNISYNPLDANKTIDKYKQDLVQFASAIMASEFNFLPTVSLERIKKNMVRIDIPEIINPGTVVSGLFFSIKLITAPRIIPDVRM